jgi:SynChlorMet cassette radical SAM/SPASM protein ScmF
MKSETDYPLKQIYFYLTSACNLKCSHCWIGPKFQTSPQTAPHLDFDLFVRIIQQARPLGLARIKLTGGEPLLHPKIERLLAFIKRSEFQIVIETNGLLCSPRLAREISQCRTACISVSLDGSRAKTHDKIRGVNGSFAAALTGIKNLVQVGLQPQIIMTVMQQNRKQLAGVVRLAADLGAGSVKFNVLQPCLRGKRMHASGEALPVAEYIKLGAWVDTELSKSTPVKLIYHQPAAFRPLSRMFGKNGGLGCGNCGILHTLGVLADGSYALCGIGEHIKDLVFGHAALDPLKDIWHANEVLRQLRTGFPDKLEGICRRCLMKRLCLGGCLAQNYYRTKRLWAPYWYCAAAQQSKLFPPSRSALLV